MKQNLLLGARPSRNIGVYIKHYVILSIIITIIANSIPMDSFNPISEKLYAWLFLRRPDVGVLRALVYFTLMYIFVIPPFSYLFHCKLKYYSPPSHTFTSKVIYTIFSIIFLGAMCSFPFVFLMFDNTSYGYPGFVYRSMTESMVGLAIIGAFFSYAVTLCLWMLLYATPKMWVSNINQGDDKL